MICFLCVWGGGLSDEDEALVPELYLHENGEQEHSWGQALGAEATFTALLVLTVLLLAAAGGKGHQFFGVAIG